MPCGKFVCQHEVARDWKTIIQHVHHILHGGYGEGKLPKFHYKFASDILEGVSSPLVWATGRTIFLLAPSQDESET